MGNNYLLDKFLQYWNQNSNYERNPEGFWRAYDILDNYLADTTIDRINDVGEYDDDVIREAFSRISTNDAEKVVELIRPGYHSVGDGDIPFEVVDRVLSSPTCYIKLATGDYIDLDNISNDIRLDFQQDEVGTEYTDLIQSEQSGRYYNVKFKHVLVGNYHRLEPIAVFEYTY